MTRERFTVVESLVLLAGTIGLLISGGALLQGRAPFWGLLPSEIFVVAAPTLLAARVGRVAPAGLGLARPSLRGILGGLLVGAGGFYLTTSIIEAAIERVAPPPPILRDELHRLIGGRPLAVELAVLALAPALCEELVFRGAILRAFLPHGRALAVFVSALGFALFHLEAYKVPPIFVLGLLFGLAATVGRSLAPSVAAHFANNAIVVALVHTRHDDPPPIASALGAALASASVAAIAAGLVLVQQGSRGSLKTRDLSG